MSGYGTKAGYIAVALAKAVRTTDLEAEITALKAELAVAKHNEKRALKEMGGWARDAGFAKGKLEASELAGVVDDWRERALAAEAKLEKMKGE